MDVLATVSPGACCRGGWFGWSPGSTGLLVDKVRERGMVKGEGKQVEG
jgi:hypothetical protein